MGQDFFVRRRFFCFPLQLALEFAEHHEFIRVSLFACAIDFQIAQHERSFAVALEENERVGRPEVRRVKHIGILFACSDDQARRFTFCFTHKVIPEIPRLRSE